MEKKKKHKKHKKEKKEKKHKKEKHGSKTLEEEEMTQPIDQQDDWKDMD